MKVLKNGEQVTSRSYYFLLDFNDRDGWKTLYDNFGVMKLHDLTKEQYIKLFEMVIKAELELLKSMQ